MRADQHDLVFERRIGAGNLRDDVEAVPVVSSWNFVWTFSSTFTGTPFSRMRTMRL